MYQLQKNCDVEGRGGACGGIDVKLQGKHKHKHILEKTSRSELLSPQRRI